MQKVALAVGLLMTAFVSNLAMAGDDDEHTPKPLPTDCPGCHEPTRDVCFNLVCDYTFERHREHDDGDGRGGDWEDEDNGPRHCTAAATFIKAVTVNGGEVRDLPPVDNHASLEVTCDGERIFNNGAHRFTDLLGTRIQGESGPTPAVLLLRGALHSGSEGQSGSHYARSILELFTPERGPIRAEGSCFIWTGAP